MFLPLHSLLEETFPPWFNPAFSWKKLLPSLPLGCSQEQLRVVQVAPGSSPGGGNELHCPLLLPCGKEEFERLQGLHQSTEISSKAGKSAAPAQSSFTALTEAQR